MPVRAWYGARFPGSAAGCFTLFVGMAALYEVWYWVQDLFTGKMFMRGGWSIWVTGAFVAVVTVFGLSFLKR